MKKILFASTALVATAGVAAADVDFSGAAGMGFGYDGSDWSTITFATLSVAMTGETDGGLSFGADFDITAGVRTPMTQLMQLLFTSKAASASSRWATLTTRLKQ